MTESLLPGFGLSEMQVVNAVEIHVLCVPREAGLPHAEVQVGGVHALDGHATVLLNYIQNRVEVANVPLLHALESKMSSTKLFRSFLFLHTSHES